jgi:hypothetical protein
MYDIGVYDANASNQKLGIYTRVVNNPNSRDVMYDGCVAVPLPIIAKQNMGPEFLSNKHKLEQYFERYSVYVYESEKYHNMARMILNNGAVPYLMPYPMELGADAVESQDIYGGTTQVSVNFKFVGGQDTSKHDQEKAIFLELLNGAVATAEYKDSNLTITLVDRKGKKLETSEITGPVNMGGSIESKVTIGYNIDKESATKIECMCNAHLKKSLDKTVSFMVGGGAFNTKYDVESLETGTYACTVLTGAVDEQKGPKASMLMYPGYGSASSTVWYVLSIVDTDDKATPSFDITFSKYDATTQKGTILINTVKKYPSTDLTWNKFIKGNVISNLSCGKSMGDVKVEPGTYVFTARGVIGGYEKWVDFWVEQLKNAPVFIATQVCVDWKYFVDVNKDRNDALKKFEEFVLEKYRTENINTSLVVDEDLVKANYSAEPKSINDEHLVVCKLNNSTMSELLTCAVAARLSANGCYTATAGQLDVSILSNPDDIEYYKSSKIKEYSGKGVLCIHKIIGVSDPVIYHDITSYKSKDYFSDVDFVHSRGYAVRTIGKLIYDIGVMYNSQYVGRLRNNTIDSLKSDVYAICKKYGESNHIVLMNIQDIAITTSPLSDTVEISLPIQISPYVETVLLTISI